MMCKFPLTSLSIRHFVMTELKLVEDNTAINDGGRNYISCSILTYKDHHRAGSFE